MSRTTWLSLTLVVFSIAAVMTGRTLLEIDRTALGSGLVSEIDALAGGPPPTELSTRVTDAAGCYPGVKPPDKTCIFVWANPSRAEYVRHVAARLQAGSRDAAVTWGAGAMVFWALVGWTIWKASRPQRTLATRRTNHPRSGRPASAGWSRRP